MGAPPAGEEYSDARPEQPYAEAAPGALRRTVFEADSGEGYRIEIQDLLVGPDREASGLTLPGAAVLEVRSGSGTITHGGETQKLETGTTLAVAAGAEIGLANASATALTVRAFILVGSN